MVDAIRREESSYRGALVTGDSVEQVVATATPAAIQWEVEVYDTDGIFLSTANTKVVVPSGVTQVRLTGNSICFGPVAPAGTRQMWLNKNGVRVVGGFYQQQGPEVVVGDETALNGSSAVLTVVGGDYFELIVQHTHGSNINYGGTSDSWFAMEIVK